MHSLDTDYLIIGSGAMGMAFADVLLNETPSRIVMVDRHHRPGGHWNDAYTFVRLHQPSARYGVNSRKLGSDKKDTAGLNKGLDELASGAEVLSYFEQVMQQQFLPTGRVQYFPMCNYVGNRQFESMLTGERFAVAVRRKIVDTAFIKLAVPSTHRPEYEIANDVVCVPLNDLPCVAGPHSGYVVVGSGKTGIDACLWLLENGVAPETIRWIMPRDAWFLDRANFQTDTASLGRQLKSFGDQMEAAASCNSVSDLFTRLEAAGQLLRIDRAVTPMAYRCATVTRAELEQLRRIRNIVRLGRVRRIERDNIVLERGTIPSDPNWLYVHCSAKAFSQVRARRVFDGEVITPQCVRTCQPVFSAAFIGHVEVSCGTDEEKNRVCGVVPLPETPLDWLRMMDMTLANQLKWAESDELRRWLAQSRLDGMAATFQSVTPADTENFALLQRHRKYIAPAAAKLRQLLSSQPAAAPLL